MAHRRNRPTLYEVVQHHRKDLQKRRAVTPTNPPAAAPPPAAGPRPVDPTPIDESALPPDTPVRIGAPGRRSAARAELSEERTIAPAATSFRWLNGALSMQLAAPSLVVALIGLAAWFGLGYYVGHRAASVERLGDPRDDLALLTAAPEAGSEAAEPAVVATPPQSASRRNAPIAAAPPVRETAREAAREPVREVGPPPVQAVRPPAAPAQPAIADTEVVPAPRAVETPKSNTPPEWQPGKFYIVLQHFPLSQAKAAEAARQYLAEQGIATVTVRQSDIKLIATEPFPSADAANGLMRKIKQAGKGYADRGGYDFNQAYTRVLKKG
jgi:hypothetical protein